MSSHKHHSSVFSFQEPRAIHFEGPKPEDLSVLKGKITEKEVKEGGEGKPESPEETERRISSLTKETNDTITKHQESMQKLPPEFQGKFANELQQYFTTSIESFDKNGVQGLSLQEFTEYKSHLLTKIDDTLGKLGGTLDQVKTEVEKKTQEAEQAKKKAELEAKSLEQVQQELLSHTLETPSDLQLDEAALNDPDHPERMQAELAKHAQRFEQLQKVQGSLSVQSQKIFDFHTKAQEELKLMGDAANAASAAVAAGVAAGAAIGIWGFGIGAVIGGAVGGLVAYGVAKGISHEVLRKEKEAKAAQLNKVIDTAKQKFDEGKKNVQTATAAFDADGQRLNQAPEALRGRQQELFSQRKEQIARRSQETQEEQGRRLAKVAEFKESKISLTRQRDLLQQRRDAITQRKEEAQKQGEAFTMRREELLEQGGEVSGAIQELQRSIPLTEDPERRSAMEQRLHALQESQKAQGGGLSALEEGGEAVAQGSVRLTEEEQRMQGARLSIDEHERTLVEGGRLLTESISSLDSHLLSLSLTEGELQTKFEEQGNTLSSVDQEIADKVLETTIVNVKSLTDLDAQSTSLQSLKPVEAPGFLNGLSQSFEGFGQAAHFVFGGIANRLDTASVWLKELVKDVPVLRNVVAVVPAGVLDVVSGLSEGVGELVQGFSTMLAHPIETGKGLGSLIGLNPDVSAGTAWKEMGKALIAYKDFSEGNVGKGVGKVALNVLLTATGGGAAIQGGRAAAIAFNGARAAGTGVAKALLKAAGKGAVVAGEQFGENLAKLPGNLVSGAGKIPNLLLKPLESLRLGKLGSIEKTIASMGDEATHLSTQIDDIVKAGKLPAELAGKSADELAAIAKNGDELVRLGITDASSIREFLNLKSLVKQSEGLQASLTAAKHTKDLLSIDEGLDGLQKVARAKNPEKLSRFIDDFNTRSPATAENLASRKYRVLESTNDGGLLAFDKTGTLTRVPAEDVSRFLTEAAKDSAAVTGGKPLLLILNNADKARLTVAQSLVGEMTPAQQQAVLKAHRMELKATEGGFRPDLKAKAEVLKQAGFETDQIDILMRTGVTGDIKVLEKVAKAAPGAKLLRGQTPENIDRALKAQDTFTRLRALAKELKEGGMLERQGVSPVLKDYLEGRRGTISGREIQAELNRARGITKAGYYSNYSKETVALYQQYVFQLEDLLQNGRALRDARVQLGNELKFTRGQKIRITHRDGSVTYGEFDRVNPNTGKVEFREVLDDVKVPRARSPENLGNFRQPERVVTPSKKVTGEVDGIQPVKPAEASEAAGVVAKRSEKVDGEAVVKVPAKPSPAVSNQPGLAQRAWRGLRSAPSRGKRWYKNTVATERRILEQGGKWPIPGRAHFRTVTRRAPTMALVGLKDGVVAAGRIPLQAGLAAGRWALRPVRGAAQRGAQWVKESWMGRSASWVGEKGRGVRDGVRAWRDGRKVAEIRSLSEELRELRAAVAKDPKLQSRYTQRMQGLEDAITEGRRALETRIKVRMAGKEGPPPTRLLPQEELAKVLEDFKDPAQLSVHIDDIAKARGIPADDLRVQVAEELIGRRLSQAEAKKLLEVHHSGPAIGEVKGVRMAAAKGRPLLEEFRKTYKAEGLSDDVAETLARADVEKLLDRGIAGTVSTTSLDGVAAGVAKVEKVAATVAPDVQSILVGRIASAEGELTSLAQKIENATIGGRRLSEIPELEGIASKGLRELNEMRKNLRGGPDELKDFDTFLSLKNRQEVLTLQKSSMEGILSGRVTLEKGYVGVRDLGKQLKLSIEEQQALAQQVLKNSGKTIDDVIRMDETVRAVRALDSEAEAILGTKVGELAKESKLTQRAAGIEKVMAGRQPLEGMRRLINSLDPGPEKTMLQELYKDLDALAGTPLDDVEKATILRESMEYLRDYKSALKKGGFEGSTVESTREVFDLLRENQRKLAHQTIVDRSYLTGSDHGVLHVLEGDMRAADRIATQLVAEGKMTAKEKVLLRQAIVDHDMGYTLNTLPKEVGDAYFGMTKDHPLYSGVRFDAHAKAMEVFFGEGGVRTLRKAVLDHSDPTASLLATDAAPNIVQNIITRADCLGVSADLKMTKLFKDPEMMGQLGRAQELAEKLKTLQKGTPAYEEAEKTLVGIKEATKRVIQERYGATPLGEKYLSSIDSYFDPKSPSVAAKRDFGSHSINYGGARFERGEVVARFDVNEIFGKVKEYFGKGGEKAAAEADGMRANAVGKVLVDFGYEVKNVQRLASRLDDLYAGKVTGGKLTTETLVQEGLIAPGKGGVKGRFEFGVAREATPEVARLSHVLNREAAFKSALEALERPGVEPAVLAEQIGNLSEHLGGYVVSGTTPDALIMEASRACTEGRIADAQAALHRLRYEGHGGV